MILERSKSLQILHISKTRMLNMSIYMYLLSKIGFNTAENGPSEVWGTHCRIYLLFGGRVSPNVALPRKLDARPEGNYLERKASRPPPQENKRQKKQEKGWNSRHTVVHPSCILDNGEGLLQDCDFISFFIPKNKERHSEIGMHQ